MTTNEMNTDIDKQLEQKLLDYFSLYTATPEYKSTLQNQLQDKSSLQNVQSAGQRVNRLFEFLKYRRVYKWILAAGLFLLVFIILFTIRPLRASIERLIDYGYLEGFGFVRVSETYVLPGTIYSTLPEQPEQTIIVDRVIADSQKTVIWLRVVGNLYAPSQMTEVSFAHLEVNGQKLLFTSFLFSYSNDKRFEEGVYTFSSLGLSISEPFILRLSYDWYIPIRLIPMSLMNANQTLTVYPDLCQTHLEIELCLRTFVSDETGYHLWLTASSKNPLFYLQTLDTWNHLEGGDATLTDSLGQQLAQVNSAQLPNVTEVSPVITQTSDEVQTTLSFKRSANKEGPLELVVGGFTGKTPANETIICELGENPILGDNFPCERSITIAGQQIRFHEGEITQHSDGTHLSIVSDPIEASNGFQLTFVDAESLYYENSSLVGVGFNRLTNQLEIWLGVDNLNIDSKFAVKITAADLTILEPFRLSWSLKP